MKTLTLETIDKKLTFSFKKAFIFTPDYQKKIGKNEFHNPLACKIIIETEKALFSFLLVKSIIITKNNKDIEVSTIFEFKKVSQEIPYFNENAKKFKLLDKIYANKKIFELSPEEIKDKDLIDTFNAIVKVLEIKIPPMIGGGF